MKKIKELAIILLVLVMVLCGVHIKKENLVDKYRVQRMVHVFNKEISKNKIKARAELYHNDIDNDYICMIYEFDEYGKIENSYSLS